MPTNSDRLYLIVVACLATIIVAMVVTLLAGLFNPMVDNDKVFAILGPAFQTIIGAFVGILSGKVISGERGPPHV